MLSALVVHLFHCYWFDLNGIYAAILKIQTNFLCYIIMSRQYLNSIGLSNSVVNTLKTRVSGDKHVKCSWSKLVSLMTHFVNTRTSATRMSDVVFILPVFKINGTHSSRNIYI